MSKRGDGFTWVIGIFSCGWGEGKNGFEGMDDPSRTLTCLLRYLREGSFTKKQSMRFLQQVNTHYRKWCFSTGQIPIEPPQSLSKLFKKD